MSNRIRSATIRPLAEYLAEISDPRHPKGRRHPLVAILCLCAVRPCAALISGAKTPLAIARWWRNRLDLTVPATAWLYQTLWPGQINPLSRLGFDSGAEPGSQDRPMGGREPECYSSRPGRAGRHGGRWQGAVWQPAIPSSRDSPAWRLEPAARPHREATSDRRDQRNRRHA